MVAAGCDVVLDAGDTGSAAADLLVAQARRADPLPLVVVCAGPLTNVAQALRQAPDIASRMTLVWVGGVAGRRRLRVQPRDRRWRPPARCWPAPTWPSTQFPLETYRRCEYSVAELEEDLGQAGRVGAWLWRRFVELPIPDFVEQGETWPLGDSPPVLLTALTDITSAWTEVVSEGAPRRVFTDVDVRLLVADLLAKLRRHERLAARR